jgi:hypothetical protein
MTMEASADARPPATPIGSLLTSSILPTLLKLALPNAIAMFGTALVVFGISTALSIYLTRW